jgi:nucleoside-diphosphate-sugar epimerase
LRVNRDGTAALATAVAEAAPRAQVLHVSSLAASQPQLSAYCESKRAGEAALMAALPATRWSILRPPAVYGPGDRETLVFFKLARLPVIPMPGSTTARIALIHVEDAVAALLARLAAGPSGVVETLADERPSGYGWREILIAAAAAVGQRNPRFAPVPRWLLRGAGGAAGQLAQVTGQAAMFNPGKLRELLHEDWSVSAHGRFHPPAPPRNGLRAGFATTADWYRQAGWL